MRHYRHKTDGYRVPSVTTIIPDGYEGAPDDQMQEAQERGRFIHEASVLLDQGNLDWSSVPEKWHGYLHGWGKAVEEMKLHFDHLWTERPTLSKRLGFGGTPARVATSDKRLTPTVIDIKSGESAGSKIKAIWGLQAAGYEILYREITGHKGRVDRYVIQVTKDGRYNPVPLDDPGDLAAFKSACAFHKWKMNKGLI